MPNAPFAHVVPKSNSVEQFGSPSTRLLNAPSAARQFFCNRLNSYISICTGASTDKDYAQLIASWVSW